MSDIITSLISLVIVLAIGNWVGSVSCQSQWKQAGYETNYGFFQGCLVKQDGKFVPSENVRVITK